MRIPAISPLLVLSLVCCLPLAAAHNASTVTKYFTNRGTRRVTVILETAVAENGKFKVEKTREKDIAPGAMNVPITIPGGEIYQIQFTLVSREHPDKTFTKGERINSNKYFAIDDDMSVEMGNEPFN